MRWKASNSHLSNTFSSPQLLSKQDLFTWLLTWINFIGYVEKEYGCKDWNQIYATKCYQVITDGTSQGQLKIRWKASNRHLSNTFKNFFPPKHLLLWFYSFSGFIVHWNDLLHTKLWLCIWYFFNAVNAFLYPLSENAQKHEKILVSKDNSFSQVR
jgi:hypothetical protein